jgi:excisionase family DNA binding protein
VRHYSASSYARYNAGMDINTHPETPSLLLTVYEFMAVVRCHESTARRWIHSGKVPFVRIGRRILIPREAVAKLLTPPDRKESV